MSSLTSSYAGALILASMAALGAAYLGNSVPGDSKAPTISPLVTPPEPSAPTGPTGPSESPVSSSATGTSAPTGPIGSSPPSPPETTERPSLSEEEARKKLKCVVSNEAIDAMFKFVKTPVKEWSQLGPTTARLSVLVGKTMTHPDRCPAVMARICALVFNKYSQMVKAIRDQPYDDVGSVWSEFAELVDELPDCEESSTPAVPAPEPPAPSPEPPAPAPEPPAPAPEPPAPAPEPAVPALPAPEPPAPAPEPAVPALPAPEPAVPALPAPEPPAPSPEPAVPVPEPEVPALPAPEPAVPALPASEPAVPAPEPPTPAPEPAVPVLPASEPAVPAPEPEVAALQEEAPIVPPPQVEVPAFQPPEPVPQPEVPTQEQRNPALELMFPFGRLQRKTRPPAVDQSLLAEAEERLQRPLDMNIYKEPGEDSSTYKDPNTPSPKTPVGQAFDPLNFAQQAMTYLETLRSSGTPESEVRKAQDMLVKQYEKELRAGVSRGLLSGTMANAFIGETRKKICGGRRKTARQDRM